MYGITGSRTNKNGWPNPQKKGYVMKKQKEQVKKSGKEKSRTTTKGRPIGGSKKKRIGDEAANEVTGGNLVNTYRNGKLVSSVESDGEIYDNYKAGRAARDAARKDRSGDETAEEWKKRVGW
jgi:hypothetical protein